MNSIATYIVDSFTSEPFKGNPAGVCVTGSKLASQQMQSIAAELGFSETAFVNPANTERTYSIRYFSPKMEIPLCGHATLAAAKVLFEALAVDQLTFVNHQQLELDVWQDDRMLVMQFPVYETSPSIAPIEMLAALGIESVANCVYNEETKIVLLEIECSQVLQDLTPDFEALVRSTKSVNGVLVTAASTVDGYDYCSRYFWPWSGTDEDPVTGGIQTFLAKYWSQRLNKNRMRSVQLSARTGWMSVELTRASYDVEKVLISGEAFVFMTGEIRVES